jgi:hypothetical protein
MKFRTKNVGELFGHWKSPECRAADPWVKVVEAREEGSDHKANLIIRKLLGVSKPMSEEIKAKLRKHNQEHQEDIKQRRKNKRQQKSRRRFHLNKKNGKSNRKTPTGNNRDMVK